MDKGLDEVTVLYWYLMSGFLPYCLSFFQFVAQEWMGQLPQAFGGNIELWL